MRFQLPPVSPRLATFAPAGLVLAALLAGCATPTVPPAPPARPSSTPSSPPPVAATASPEEARIQQDFANWVAQFRVQARAAGIDEATLRSAFDGVRFLPRVIELDRSQAEFVRPVWDYLDTAVSAIRVTRGQEQLQALRPELASASARYGVPPEIVVAIWGMESNYGSNYGDIPAIDALATLGFEGRRAGWAREQLMAALRILQSGDIARERMVGSWAGAMGQTQFLPTVFLAHAVDADGDGRRDIWSSMADVTASTANFLKHSGWQPGQPWGVEVRLPPGFDLGRADGEQRQAASQWAAEGVRPATEGAALPDLPDAAILLPAGARGPAFLVGPNFRTILRYNNATSYALGVGLLAQRIAGGPAVQAAWPRDLQPLSRSELIALQTALDAKGFGGGKADGLLGPATREAIRRYQRSAGLAPDGYPTTELLRQIGTP